MASATPPPYRRGKRTSAPEYKACTDSAVMLHAPKWPTRWSRPS